MLCCTLTFYIYNGVFNLVERKTWRIILLCKFLLASHLVDAWLCFFYSHHVWLKGAVKITSSIALLNLDFTRVTEIWGPFTETWLNCYWGHEALVSPSWSSTLVWAFKNWTQKDIYRVCPEFQWEPMFCLIWFVVVCLTLSQNNSWHFSICCSIISSEMLKRK